MVEAMERRAAGPWPGGGGGWQRGMNVNVTSLESRWWYTSVIGTIVDPPQYSMDVVDAQDANNATSLSSRCRRRHNGAGLFRAMMSSRVPPHVRGNTRWSFRSMMEWAAHVNIPSTSTTTMVTRGTCSPRRQPSVPIRRMLLLMPP